MEILKNKIFGIIFFISNLPKKQKRLIDRIAKNIYESKEVKKESRFFYKNYLLGLKDK